MKFIKLVVLSMLIMQSHIVVAEESCTSEDIQYFIDYGLGESLDNDCYSGHDRFKNYGLVLGHFSRMVLDKQKECKGKLSKRDSKLLSASMFQMALKCYQSAKRPSGAVEVQ